MDLRWTRPRPWQQAPPLSPDWSSPLNSFFGVLLQVPLKHTLEDPLKYPFQSPIQIFHSFEIHWSFNRNEFNEFILTGNGLKVNLDLSLTNMSSKKNLSQDKLSQTRNYLKNSYSNVNYQNKIQKFKVILDSSEGTKNCKMQVKIPKTFLDGPVQISRHCWILSSTVHFNTKIIIMFNHFQYHFQFDSKLN